MGDPEYVETHRLNGKIALVVTLECEIVSVVGVGVQFDDRSAFAPQAVNFEISQGHVHFVLWDSVLIPHFQEQNLQIGFGHSHSRIPLLDDITEPADASPS